MIFLPDLYFLGYSYPVIILPLNSRSVIVISFILNLITHADFPVWIIKKILNIITVNNLAIMSRNKSLLQTRLDLIATDRLQTTTADTRCTTLTGRPGTIITTTRGRPTIVSGRLSPVTGRRATRSTINSRRTCRNTTSTSNSITATAAAQRVIVRASWTSSLYCCPWPASRCSACFRRSSRLRCCCTWARWAAAGGGTRWPSTAGISPRKPSGRCWNRYNNNGANRRNTGKCRQCAATVSSSNAPLTVPSGHSFFFSDNWKKKPPKTSYTGRN